MNLKTITRNAEEYTRARSQDLYKVHRNLDSTLHPFQKAREYARALNSVKVSRLMAKPFLGALSGHIDGIYAMEVHPSQLTTVYSGSGDGEVRMWDMSTKETLWKVQAHDGVATGVSVCPVSDVLISVGNDRNICLWDTHKQSPLLSISREHAVTDVSHHRRNPLFATSSTCVELWDHTRSTPTSVFKWGEETVTSVSFNQAETNILASCGSERTIALYDIRQRSTMTKVTLALRSNALRWNPMEPFHFAVANEDHNCYIFDMRNLGQARNVYKDHVSAVMDVDVSPTGRELVTGSYDKSIRIFDIKSGHSKEVFHTSRMQHVQAVRYSMDSKFILSGSDDGNIRLWRAVASDRLGSKTAREKDALRYNQKLVEKFKHMPEIKRINRQRNVPKHIQSVRQRKNVMIQSEKKRRENERLHTAPENVVRKPEKQKVVVQQHV